MRTGSGIASRAVITYQLTVWNDPKGRDLLSNDLLRREIGFDPGELGNEQETAEFLMRWHAVPAGGTFTLTVLGIDSSFYESIRSQNRRG